MFIIQNQSFHSKFQNSNALQSTNLSEFQKFVPNDYEGLKLSLHALMTSAPQTERRERFGEGGSHRRKGGGGGGGGGV